MVGDLRGIEPEWEAADRPFSSLVRGDLGAYDLDDMLHRGVGHGSRMFGSPV